MMAGVRGWSGDGAEGRVVAGIVGVGALGTAAGGSVTAGGDPAAGSVEVVADGSDLGGAGGMIIGAGGIVIGVDGAVVDDDGMGGACRDSPSALCFGSTVLVSATSHVTMSALAKTTTTTYNDTLLIFTV
ncbi:MAG TPA: hypothetical protein VII76_08370 [Acidimicrobiales bacterium]